MTKHSLFCIERDPENVGVLSVCDRFQFLVACGSFGIWYKTSYLCIEHKFRAFKCDGFCVLSLVLLLCSLLALSGIPLESEASHQALAAQSYGVAPPLRPSLDQEYTPPDRRKRTASEV